MHPNTPPHAGFQLIELLIVLGIVGIVSAFALPMYSRHLVNSHGQEAVVVLTRLVLAMEEYGAEHHSYAGATVEKLHFPNLVAENNYWISVENADGEGFVVTAAPVGKQAEQDKRCGVLSLSDKGEKSISGVGSVAECWL